VDTVLLVCGEKTADIFREMLIPHFFARCVHVVSASKARRIVTQQPYGLIVVCAPLPDEAAGQLADALARISGADVVLLGELPGEGAALCDGVVVLEKPVNRMLFTHTLLVLETARKKWQRLAEENRKLSLKLEEARLVGRAKCALVAYRQMTEEQAHHYIEKQAMDGRLPRREVAKDILSMFEG
jgi:response regulator NasT